MVNSSIMVSHSFSKDFVRLMQYLAGKYDEEVFKIQGIANSNLDIVEFSKDFFNSAGNVADISVDSNANVNEKNIVQYNSENSKALMRLNALYLLHRYIKKEFSKKDADECIEAIVNGEIFINDLHLVQNSYCYSFDLTKLLEKGMNFFSGNMVIGAPKRSDSFIALVIQTTAYISNQISGAIAYPSFFVLLDYFYRKEYGNEYLSSTSVVFKDRLKNNFQNLIYSLNFPFRSNQSSFTNLSVLDMGFLNSLFGDYSYPDGTKPDFESIYGLSKMFFEYYTKINGGEAGMFTFPVMTLAISLDEEGNYLDKEFVDWVAESNCEKSLANVFMDLPNSFSSCCRLISNFDKIKAFQNSFGVGGVSIGSVRVAGINLPRYAKLIENKSTAGILEGILEKIHKVLFAQREILKDRIKQGVLPLYTHDWMSLSRQYSTIGFVGGYEYMMMGYEQINKSAVEDLVEVLSKISEISDNWSQEDGLMYNVEQIPAESMAVRLAKLDKLLGYQEEYEMYSNQYISLMENVGLHERFELQGKFDNLTSGGAILHINVDEDSSISKKQFRMLIDMANKTRTRYFGVNYVFSRCSKHSHISIGNYEKCPLCGSPVHDRLTRVVGFLTNVKHWNKVRREFEFPKRVFYSHKVIEE